ncbi:uncharacterized protein KY384_006760 [Bacidia gigantensis]|uniref:uncharacterized protein n=1 Tax=Bacidia gigantensis TaxID=2732470 RepID=UPI001D038760|nr:uncharacterized protein KY384_006760 [Bacidia gigantensis]KAG8527844.1 hypothetical protein KY384_006760 [Bacidia gigantensis]
MRQSPLYLGFDLSTQQLKGVAVSPDLKVEYNATFDFDQDAADFGIKKGVLTNEAEHEVFAPVLMWLRAIDVVLRRLKDTGLDFSRVQGISGAGMQHGSVYWSQAGVEVLQKLDHIQGLERQMTNAFSYPYSPNWQDASTQAQCDLFDKALGNETNLAQRTGSKAHHRFTGPQILRMREKHPIEYNNTARISLVSSFLASIFLGKVAPIDISDACGMNLWDIENDDYNVRLLEITAGSKDTAQLRSQLGHIPDEGGISFGRINSYFVERYGFDPSCKIIPFTGDNPSTILALPLRPLDAIVSLGTSTTFLMSTPYYKPDPAVHFMNHPTTPGLYMFMLCYKNGGLAREQIRDSLPAPIDSNDAWAIFNSTAISHSPLNAPNALSPAKVALYFPRPEIVPNVREGTYRFIFDPTTSTISTNDSDWKLPEDDARAILESQLLSLRLRSHNIVAPPDPNPENLPAQPRRIYLVGGGSYNPAIAKLAGEILGGVEGVYRLDVGGNACALGSAYKAVWACEKEKDETFERFIGERWREDEFVERVADGYQKESFERYEVGVKALGAVEKVVLERQQLDVGMAGTSGAGAPANAP